MEQEDPRKRLVEREEASQKLTKLREQKKHRMKERHAREAQRDVLEALYQDEFVIDNPPECYERYEADTAIAYLRGSIERQHIEAEHDDVRFDDEEIKAAKDTIDIMATYGQLAEKDIAALTRMDLPAEVYTHAIDTLSEVREEDQEPPTIREAIARWLSP